MKKVLAILVTVLLVTLTSFFILSNPKTANLPDNTDIKCGGDNLIFSNVNKIDDTSIANENKEQRTLEDDKVAASELPIDEQLELLSMADMENMIMVANETLEIRDKLLEEAGGDSFKIQMLQKTFDEHLASIDQMQSELMKTDEYLEKAKLFSKIGFEYYYMFQKTHPSSPNYREYLTKSMESFNNAKMYGSATSAFYLAQLAVQHKTLLFSQKIDEREINYNYCLDNYLEAFDILKKSEKDWPSNKIIKHSKWLVNATLNGIRNVCAYTGEHHKFMNIVNQLCVNYDGTVIGSQIKDFKNTYAYNKYQKRKMQ